MSLWLARISLDGRSRHARHDLRDAVALHKRVMSLLPDGLGEYARRDAGVLYRLDETATGYVVLVQTRLAPDPNRLPGGYGRFEVRDATALLEALKPGTMVYYRIAANASKRQSTAGETRRRGPVVPLSGEAAEQWWARKAEAHGLRLLRVRVQPLPVALGHGGESTNPIRHAITRFDGAAAINDADLVRSAVQDGIGRGKSYGCGLLSLAHVRRS